LNSKIYVDKTGLIEYTNELISTEQRFLCVSRPRRFGKSMAANMLGAYYCLGCDSHAQFDGLQISNAQTYETHINKYNVVYINVVKFINKTVDTKSGIETIKENLVDDFKTAYPDITFRKEEPISMLEKIYGEKKIKFVFLIDEWDSPFREQKADTDGHDDYLVFLRSLFKDQEYVALAYMTGIHGIKKFCTNSSLNMFQEFSMEFPGPVKQYFGFTDGEVKALCAERGFSYDGIRDWYDGYIFENKPGEDLHMYNSNSVVSAILDNQLMSYWPRTESFEDLKQYIRLNSDGLHDVLTKLLCGDTYQIQEEIFFEDDTTQRYLNKILKQLVNLGYLAYDRGKSSVYIPNLEIKREFIEVISGMGDDPLSMLVSLSLEILDTTLNKDGEKLANLIAKFHEDLCPHKDVQ
ncbi:MAG: AAA family ATPase, partial [Clostridia bacterium]|nr:AAA family ATPase [Clostridia bacterium]